MVSRIETPPFTSDQIDEIKDILAPAYGPRFKPELAEQLLSRSQGCIGVEDNLGSLAAVAVVCENKRIAMSAAAYRSSREERHAYHREALHAARAGDYGQWLTVGEHYGRVQSLMQSVGMTRITKRDEADILLHGLNGDRPPLYDKDEDGKLLVVSQHDSAHPGYRQQILAWRDK